MSKLKLIYLFFVVPILTYGQCFDYTFRVEFDNNNSENEITLSGSNGFNETYTKNGGDWSGGGGAEFYEELCLDPGQYTFTITDSGENGINYSNNNSNGIYIYEGHGWCNVIWCYYPNNLLYNFTGNNLDDNWSSHTYSFTVGSLDCDEPYQESYRYGDHDYSTFEYSFESGEIAELNISGRTQYDFDYIYIYDGSDNLLETLNGTFGSTWGTNPIISNDNIIKIVFDSDNFLSAETQLSYDDAIWSVSCKQDDIVGCTNETATNYNSDATTDDGSCIIPGCTNSSAENFDASATTDDGSCIIYGCTTETATNYNPDATVNDGICNLNCDSINQSSYSYENNDNMSFDYLLPEGEIASITLSGATYFGDVVSIYDGDGNPISGLTGEFSDTTIESNDNGISIIFQDFIVDGNSASSLNLEVTSWTINCAALSCDKSYQYNYAYTNNDTNSFDYIFPEGEIAIITISGQTEACCDFINVNTGAGNALDTLEGDFLYPPSIIVSNDNGISLTFISNGAISPENPDGYNVAQSTWQLSCAVQGCMNEIADNYDALANFDDGSCVISGCQDTTACNYNVSATDSAQCLFVDDICETCSGEIDGTGIIVDNDIDNDGVCDADEIVGCQDSTACNYNVSATDSAQCLFVDGICETCSGEIDGTGIIVDNDIDNDGICDSLEVAGCQDATACNFNEIATDPDACVYAADLDACATCSGETDGTGTIIDNDADDDGICDSLEVAGCQDATACNYNVNATDSAQCFFVDGICETCSGAQDGTGTIVDNDADNDGICDSLEVAGCQDATACNYNVSATDSAQCIYSEDLDECATCSGETDGTGTIVDNDADDDGICDADELDGCIDPLACNYDDTATESSDCIYSSDLDACATCSGETDGTGTIVDNDADNDGVCDADEIVGCQDATACNYDNTATDAGECNYLDGICETCVDGSIIDNDADDDGVCDADELVGCQDSIACNYDTAATDAGPCTFVDGICESCSGETDGTGIIVDNDIDNDGVCNDNEVEGCTYSNACNYNPFATNYDLSCFWPDILDCDGNCINDQDLDGVCDENEILGCNDASSCNYDSLATDNDGSCEFPLELYTCEGNCILDDDGDGICNALEIIGCLDNNACNYSPNVTDIVSCVYPDAFYDCNGNCLNDVNNNSICDELEVEGCTNSEACNFNANANIDDNSCEFAEQYYNCDGTCLNDVDQNGICDEFGVLGCMDSDACNFNANATVDDETCEYVEVTLEYNYSSLLLIANSNVASPTYQWNINEEETNITSDRVDAFFEGTYTVTVIDEENNCWGEALYTINGVSILEISSNLNLYPNPVYSILNIKTKLNISNTTIEIYNILGELCKIHQHINADETQIDVTQLNSGMYTVKIKSKDFIIQKEFIKY